MLGRVLIKTDCTCWRKRYPQALQKRESMSAKGRRNRTANLPASLLRCSIPIGNVVSEQEPTHV
jgi:hypothetical protein